MITAIIFIIIIGILVFVHEFGHFVMAKRAGMKVEEFGFGFPPRIFGIKKGETIYSLNWIPFGGFVKIFGESGEGEDSPRSFVSKSIWARSKVIVAGVVMNIILAAVLLGFGNIFGLRTAIPEDPSLKAENIKVQIVYVSPDSPAQNVGLEALDEIVGFKEGSRLIQIKNIKETQEYIKNSLGKEITMIIRRGDIDLEEKIVPRINPPAGDGAVGISLAVTGILKYPWYQAFYKGITQTAFLTSATVGGYAGIIKNIFISGSTGAELSGPIGIAIYTGKAAKIGFTYLMQFTALISVNLAVLNIIPFPALDGGRLLFIIVEKFKGKPISRKVENMINGIGFSALILLMIYVTSKDIIKFF